MLVHFRNKIKTELFGFKKKIRYINNYRRVMALNQVICFNDEINSVYFHFQQIIVILVVKWLNIISVRD